MEWLIIAAIVLWWLGQRSPRSSGKGRFTPTYKKFINSPEWRAKRAKVIARDGGKCRKCGSRSRLQVDHVKHPPRGCNFQAFVSQPNSQLQTLCERCHKQVTRQRRKR